MLKRRRRLGLLFGVCGALLGAAALGPKEAAGAPATITLGDHQNYTIGPYLAYLGPWNKGRLVYGKDYTESLTVRPATFPNATSIVWRWPRTPPAEHGVYNFLHIAFGNYNNTVVQTPIAPKKVSAIKTLIQTHDLTLTGELEGYDVITDFFLTRAPGDSKTQAFEIEVFLHTPPYSADFVRSGRQIGVFREAGRAWTVALIARPTPIILFAPARSGEVKAGTIDLAAMLRYLIAQKVLTGEEYFNGLGLGVEVRQGAGAATINAFSVVYE